MNNICCSCKRTACERYGNCDECKAYHHDKNSLTRCEKLKKKEQKRSERQRKKG